MQVYRPHHPHFAKSHRIKNKIRFCLYFIAVIATALPAISQDQNSKKQMKEADNATRKFRTCQVYLVTSKTDSLLDYKQSNLVINSLNLTGKKKIVTKNPDFVIVLQLDSVILDQVNYLTRPDSRLDRSNPQKANNNQYEITATFTTIIHIRFQHEEKLIAGLRIDPGESLIYGYTVYPYKYVNTTWYAQKELNIERELQDFKINFLKNTSALLSGIRKTLEATARNNHN